MTWPFSDPPDVAVFTTRQVVEGTPIVRVTHDADDGAWQFHGELAANVADAMVVALEEIVKLDPTVKELAHLPLGFFAVRQVGHPWVIHEQ